MPSLSQLTSALFDARDHTPELAYLAHARAHIDMPLEVRVANAPFALEAIDPVGRSRLRATLARAGEQVRVSLDALQSDDPLAQLLFDAYRHWLSTLQDGEVDAELFRTLIPSAAEEAAVDELRRALKKDLNRLAKLDTEELESWLGDDDPWGAHKKYWPEDMYTFQDVEKALERHLREVHTLQKAGITAPLGELLDTLFRALAPFVFEYYCPDAISKLAAMAIERLLDLAVASARTPNEIEGALDEALERVQQFKTGWLNDRDFRALPKPWFEALLARIAHLLGQEHTDHSELRKLAINLQPDPTWIIAHIGPQHLTSATFSHTIERLEASGRLEEAIDLCEAWLEHHGESYAGNSARATLAALKLKAGGESEDLLEELWEVFKQSPTVNTLRALRKTGDRDEVDARAMDMIERADDVFRIAAELDLSKAIVKRIREIEREAIRRTSSWTLQEVAPKLEAFGSPQTAALVYTALGWRHVERGKSKYYHLGLEAFEHAHRLIVTQMGDKARWDTLAKRMEREHGRKRSFIGPFRDIGDGEG